MAKKKKQTLISKAAIATQKPKILKKVEPTPQFEENPFLKLLTVTKKDKQLNKSKTFNDRIGLNPSDQISKSALRRRKRKAKESLKPKMEDLLDMLPETGDNNDDKYVSVKPVHVNEPNVLNRRGHAVVFKQENHHFNSILKDQQFRASPFSTLRQVISKGIDNSQDNSQNNSQNNYKK